MIAFSSGPTAAAEDGRNEFCREEVGAYVRQRQKMHRNSPHKQEH